MPAWWRDEGRQPLQELQGRERQHGLPVRSGLGELVDQTLHPRRGPRGPSLSSALGRLRKEQLLEDVTVGVCDHCGNSYYSVELLHAVRDLATGKRMPERTEARDSPLSARFGARRLFRASQKAMLALS